jgi:hypothetical protein
MNRRTMKPMPNEGVRVTFCVHEKTGKPLALVEMYLPDKARMLRAVEAFCAAYGMPQRRQTGSFGRMLFEWEGTAMEDNPERLRGVLQMAGVDGVFG